MNVIKIGSTRPLLRLVFTYLLLLTFSPCYAASKESIQVFQKNVHLSETHKQRLADAVTRYRNAENIWDALRQNFTMYHYESHPLVQQKIEWYMNNQDFLLRAASRAAPYMYYILQEVKKRHLPAEIVLLPIIESGYNPFAISSAGATGLWQMMPRTAQGLGIRQDRWYDGRRDIIASTRGALNYLAYLQSFFDGNWRLAIAAYNTGEGNVLSAIRRNIRLGKDTSFWSLPLARQTRDYVPSLLALAAIISNPSRYPVYLPPVRNAQYLAQVDIGKQINMKKVARYAGISYRKLKGLNPGYNNVVTSKGPYKIILPIENVEQFSENYLRFTPNSGPVRWVHYSVQQGDTLSSIAKRFNTTIRSLRKMNHLKKDMIQLGATILIPERYSPKQLASKARKTGHHLATRIASNEKKSSSNIIKSATSKTTKLAQKAVKATKLAFKHKRDKISLNINPGDTIYMVRQSDSISKIAQHFDVSQDSIMTKNKLKSTAIRPGQQLIIPTGSTTTASAQKLTKSSKKTLKPGDTIYMVRHGDTLSTIAARYKTTTAKIKLANSRTSNHLEVGEQLILPTHKSG